MGNLDDFRATASAVTTWTRLDPEWIASPCGRWRICKLNLWCGRQYALWDWDLIECIAVRESAKQAIAFADALATEHH